MSEKNTTPAVPSLFNFGDHKVRVVEIDGNPWFVATDVCRCLGLSLVAGTSQHMVRIGEDEKRLLLRREHPEIFSGSRAPSMNAVSESGLYKLTLRADETATAKAFQDWVTKEVLPAIRKDGAYVMGEEKTRTGELSAQFSPL